MAPYIMVWYQVCYYIGEYYSCHCCSVSFHQDIRIDLNQKLLKPALSHKRVKNKLYKNQQCFSNNKDIHLHIFSEKY